MAVNIQNENKIVISVLGVIYLASLVIVIIQFLTKISFGLIGVLAWIVFITGSLSFVYRMLFR